MDFERLNGDLRELRKRNGTLGLALGGMAAAQLLSCIVLLTQVGRERVVVVPPTLSRTFWVEGERVSSAYLEQMGGFLAWLVLDISPGSVDWKKSVLLSYVEPEQFEALRTQQDLQADRLKRLNASTSLEVQEMVGFEDEQSLVIRGRLSLRINGAVTSNEPRAYRLEFSHRAGRIHLKTFKEIPYASPLDAATAASLPSPSSASPALAASPSLPSLAPNGLADTSARATAAAPSTASSAPRHEQPSP
jgi:conjugal transfer pilus assembly protein TraE